MSYSSNRYYHGTPGGADMAKQRSADSAYSYQSNMSSLEDQPAGSPYTAVSSEYDNAPAMDYSCNDSLTYGSGGPYQYLQHDQLHNHLSMSNPNGSWPPESNYVANGARGSMSSQSYGYSDSGQSGGSDASKPTPRSLGWSRHNVQSLLQKYVFCVPEGKEARNAYFDLLEGEAVTPMTPKRVHLEVRSGSDPKSFLCTFPTDECIDKKGKHRQFARAADLGRHYLYVHTPKDKQKTIICGYSNCNRKENYPLSRKDHYRDHLREYHKEDLGEARKEKGDTRAQREKRQRAWEAERRINPRNWRCAKCLHNNRSERGWICTECQVPCEEERKEKRIQLLMEKEAAGKQENFVCQMCNGSGYVPGTYDDCPACQNMYFTSYGDFDMQMQSAEYYSHGDGRGEGESSR